MLANTTRQARQYFLLCRDSSFATQTPQNIPLAFATISRSYSCRNIEDTAPAPTKRNIVPPVNPTKTEYEAWIRSEVRRYAEQFQKLMRAYGRSPFKTPIRYYRDDDKKVTTYLKGGFSRQEDEKLAQLVHEHGRNWHRVAEKFGPTRHNDTLQRRYLHVLEPAHLNWEHEEKVYDGTWSHEEIQRHFHEEYIKGGRNIFYFSYSEHRILMDLVKVYGTRFKVMATIFAGRKTSCQLVEHYDKVQKIGLEQIEEKYRKQNRVIELVLPKGWVTGDPKWTSREIYEMEKVVRDHREGKQVNPSKVALLFPGRTDDELNRMWQWVFRDSETRLTKKTKLWTAEEKDLLKQFVGKYGSYPMLLYKSRILPGRNPAVLAQRIWAGGEKSTKILKNCPK